MNYFRYRIAILSIAFSFAISGCVEMAINREMSRLESEYKAGRIPEEQYQIRHAQIARKLAFHQAEVTRIMAQAQPDYTASDSYTPMQYVQTGASSQPHNPQPERYTPAQYVQSAQHQPHDPAPENYNPSRYLQTAPRQPQSATGKLHTIPIRSNGSQSASRSTARKLHSVSLCAGGPTPPA